MGTFILSSSGQTLFSQEVEELLDKKFREYKIAYITTAGNLFKNTEYISIRKREMLEKKLDFTEIDLSLITHEKLEKELIKYNMVYVEGGNTFYLLKHVRMSGFDTIIKKLIVKGAVYMGSSAGVYISCPTIDMALLGNIKKDRCGMIEFSSMNIIDFYIKAHYTDTEKEKQELIDISKRLHRKIYTLSDLQTLVVKNKHCTLLGKGGEKIF